MALLGNPFVANIPRQMSTEELAQALRVDMAGELEAIIGYEAHAMATNDERVKKILYHNSLKVLILYLSYGIYTF